MTDTKLADFQAAAVRLIVSRLRARTGSKRFLLADEVGLGKTLVAKGVIDELAKRRPKLRVVYLCSNTEIAAQNRPKLAPGAGITITRATELALNQTTSSSGVELYSLTPGTSMKPTPGRAWERQLLLFLMNRAVGIDVSTKAWRTFFRCNAGERWESESKWAALRDRFGGKVSVKLQAQLRVELLASRKNDIPLRDALQAAVEAFREKHSDDSRRRNKLVGELRNVVQRVALRACAPDLVLLDEVQRFRDVIDEAKNATHVASELLVSGTPVLILSATPYRWYTPDAEAAEVGDHHKDFFSTLSFLFDKDARTPGRIRRNLELFGKRLRDVDLSSARDEGLVKLKRAIEADVRMVVCRTERNWYVLDARKHVDQEGSIRDLPRIEAIKEYMDIHRGLRKHLDGPAMVTEFWKSAPAVLSFMDKGYALTKQLLEADARVPRGLLADGDDLTLIRRNSRMQHLVTQTLGSADRAPPLWTRPTYTYYDSGAATVGPRKMLVFSGWRFVPKSIGVVVSQEAARRLRLNRAKAAQPLRFTEKRSFHVFDVCFPSPALAEILNPRMLAQGDAELPTVVNLVRAGERALRKKLLDVNVQVAKQGSDPLWRVVARLEACGIHAKSVRDAVSKWEPDETESADGTQQHQDWFLDWFDERVQPLRISEDDLYYLTLVGLFSPATCLLRSLTGVYGGEPVLGKLKEVIELSFGALRRYFNRPLNQQAVRRHRSPLASGRRGGRHLGFTRHVLAYAADHHLQAVLDEHVFLLQSACSCSSPTAALKNFETVWSLGRGVRRTNGATGRGNTVRLDGDARSFQTHFALAFGEAEEKDVTPDRDAGDDRMRQTAVREAFNSPFWPFVLATTSVGQEGLDFHLHCRDLFHWNLPSNPVDLEQREGRINRRDCLAVRASIAVDWTFQQVTEGLSPTANPWPQVFEMLESDTGDQRFKHGLYPHWIYECREAASTVGIRRHIALYEHSRDAHRFERLKRELALYRLVFGQANQEDMLNNLEARLAALPENERDVAKRRLASYMLNLSPMGAAESQMMAHREADKLFGASNAMELERLLVHVTGMCAEHAELKPASGDVAELVRRVRNGKKHGKVQTRQVRTAVVALVNLRNPYDRFFDFSAAGFDDDIEEIRRALGKTRSRSVAN